MAPSIQSFNPKSDNNSKIHKTKWCILTEASIINNRKKLYLKLNQYLCISFIIINIYHHHHHHHHHHHYHNIIIIIMMLYSSYASSCISLPLYLSKRSIILSCSNWCMRSTSSSATTNSQNTSLLQSLIYIVIITIFNTTNNNTISTHY